MDISFYNERGEITGYLSGDAGFVETTKDMTAEPWIDGKWDGATHYVLDGRALPRPANPTRHDGRMLTFVPRPAKITINDKTYDADDSVVELWFNLPGKYKVGVQAWPHLDAEFTVEA